MHRPAWRSRAAGGNGSYTSRQSPSRKSTGRLAGVWRGVVMKPFGSAMVYQPPPYPCAAAMTASSMSRPSRCAADAAASTRL
jgi:hypothetical protein